MKNAEIIIIGAGVIGASIAYHLAARGAKNIIMLDRFLAAGQGSTGRATGGFRAQFASEVNVRLSLLARTKLRNFHDELGADCGYQPVGYLFLARHEHELQALLAAQAVQHRAGLTEARPVAADEIRYLNPHIGSDELIGAVFCASDGYIRPLEILRGYLENAARLGVKIEYGVEITGMRRNDNGRISGVTTTRGDYSADWFVNAAGAWAGVVAKYAGIELPVVPLRRQVAITHPTDLLPADIPMTIYAEDGFHFRVRDGRILLLRPDHTDQSDQATSGDLFDTTFAPRWLAGLMARAHAALPALKDVEIDRERCWCGLYEMSPDKHAIVGRMAAAENLLLANGSSGHGVMHAPALGQLISELLLDGEIRAIDAMPLRPTRFDEGALNPLSDIL